ncbi:MAG: hypothetical protein ACKO34_06040, partial [Vampirovibrionales bacterium]
RFKNISKYYIIEATVGVGCLTVAQDWHQPVKAKAQQSWQWLTQTAQKLTKEATAKAKSLA